jgi:hypothetical protein
LFNTPNFKLVVQVGRNPEDNFVVGGCNGWFTVVGLVHIGFDCGSVVPVVLQGSGE